MPKYTQNGEEAIILDVFKDRVGRLLDIGAADGVTFSNTRALMERGWAGVFLEPSPGMFAALCKTYSADDSNPVAPGGPRAELRNLAVGPSEGPVTFYDSPDFVSTTEIAHRDKWAKAVSFTPITVAQVTPAWLLERHPGPYDFVSIDTEGTSADLFLAFYAMGLRPTLWMVEHDSRADELERCAPDYVRCYIDGNNVGLLKKA